MKSAVHSSIKSASVLDRDMHYFGAVVSLSFVLVVVVFFFF